MKKRAAAFALALVMALSCAPTAFADTGEFLAYPEGTVIDLSDESVKRDIALVMEFHYLGTNGYCVSDESYYTETGEITLDILSATWSPADCPLWIGFLKIGPHRDFGYKFTGGSITDWTLTEAPTMGEGYYYIFVKNLGPDLVSGVMQYRVRN